MEKEKMYSLNEAANEWGVSVEELIKLAKANGLIDDDGKPTEMALKQGLLVDDIIETEYMQTVNMTTNEEIEQWETKNKGCVIIDDIGRRIELKDAEWWSADKDLKPTIPTGQHFLSLAACDDECDTELLLTVTSINEVRKLRDFLNDYLEGNLG